MYYTAVFFAQLANYGHFKTMHSRLDQPSDPGARAIYGLFGWVAFIVLLVLLIAGFFLFSWWTPVVALITMGLLTGVIAGTVLSPRVFGSLYVLFGCPISVVLTFLLFVLR